MGGRGEAVIFYKRLDTVALVIALAIFACSCGGTSEEETLAEHLESPLDMVLVSSESGDRIYVLNGLQGSIAVYNPESSKFVRGATDDEDSPNFFEQFLYDMDAARDGRLLISSAKKGEIYVFSPLTEGREKIELDTSPVKIYCSSTEDLCALLPANEQKILMLRTSDLQWDEYQLEFLPELALFVGQQIFYFCVDKIVVASTSSPDTIISEVAISGIPLAAHYSEYDKLIYLATSDSSKLWIFEPESQALDSVDLPEQAFATALVDIESELYLVGAEGGVYVYLKDYKRFCGAKATRPVFIDEGQYSNPKMSKITVRDCLVNDEKWTVKFDQKERAYSVKGEKSGKQATLAYENQTYVSDSGAISFVIHSGDYHATDGDRFEFKTEDGVGFIKVGLLPRAAITWFSENEDKDKERWLVFVSNLLSDSISVIDTKEHEIIDTLE